LNNVRGINAGNGSTISGCTSKSNVSQGILAGEGCTISECTARSNTGDGIRVLNQCRVVDNTCSDNGLGAGDGAGIYVIGTANRIDNNQVASSDRGLHVVGAGNLIFRNSASSNTTNYDIAINNKVGVTVSPPSSSSFTGDTGGMGVDTTDPWANFSF
jgi:parallel beta-helix repeat protein